MKTLFTKSRVNGSEDEFKCFIYIEDNLELTSLELKDYIGEMIIEEFKIENHILGDNESYGVDILDITLM